MDAKKEVPALFLFGPPRLMQNGVNMPVRRKKVFALLSYLAAHQRSFSRESLSALLWPDSEESRARSNLRKILSDLHGLLGRDVLPSGGGMLGPLNTEMLRVDVVEFQQRSGQLHCGEGDLREDKKDLEELTLLYTGDFMSGFSLRECDRYDEWQFLYGEYLRQELCSVLECYIEHCEHEGDVKAGVRAGRRLVEIDPLNEAAHRALMRLFLLGGEMEAARLQYRLCVEILDKELGVQPEQETLELFEKSRSSAAPEHSRAAGRRITERRIPGQRIGVKEEAKLPVPTEEIVRQVTSEKNRLEKYTVGSPQLQARNLCMMGDFVLRSSIYGDGNILRARKYFGRAIRLDRSCSDAYAGLAFSYFSLGGYGVDARIGERRKVKVDSLVDQALKFDPRNSRALMVRGGKKMEWDWDFEGAEQCFRKALEVNPEHSDTLLWFAELLMVLARFDEAYPLLMKAHELNPLGLAVNLRLAKFFLRTGKFEKALDWMDRLIEVYPERFLLLYLKVTILLEMERFDDAIRIAEKTVHLRRICLTLAHLSIALSLGGDRGQALRTLGDCEDEYGRSEGEDASWVALAHHAAGHREEMFRWLDRAYEDHDIGLIKLPTDPLWGELHRDSRFQAFLKKAGLPLCLDYIEKAIGQKKTF